MPPHLSTNFEIQKYYQNEPKFKGVYSRNNLTKTKDGAYVTNRDRAYVINLNRYSLDLYANDNDVTYFGSSGIEHTLKQIKKFIGNKNIIKNIFRIQAYNSIMCEHLLYWFYWFYVKK